MRRPFFIFASLLSVAAPVRAFSDPFVFTEPTTAGGGGGRFFTGSPVDGYTCAVCHRGAPDPVVTVRGLPASYLPGETYDVSLSWAGTDGQHALTLELVDENGQAAGLVELPEPSELEAADYCEESLDDAVAAYLTERDDRQIVGVNPCGATSLRFRFTPFDVARVAFAGSVVRSDNSESSDGDGVLDLRQILLRDGERANVRTATAEQCASHPGSSERGGSAGLVALIAGLLLTRRAARRRALSSSRS